MGELLLGKEFILVGLEHKDYWVSPHSSSFVLTGIENRQLTVSQAFTVDDLPVLFVLRPDGINDDSKDVRLWLESQRYFWRLNVWLREGVCWKVGWG